MAKDLMGFRSSWAQFLSDFIREKRACGYRYATQDNTLQPLDRMWCERGAPDPSLSRAWAEKFIAVRPGESPANTAKRASLWRELARYGERRGMAAYIPPTGTLPLASRQFAPYIYSRAELQQLFLAIDRYPASTAWPGRTAMLAVLYRLLYGTGMRVGEALGLNHADFDSREGVITIHQGKNQRDRLVPLAPALAKRLASYCRRFPGDRNAPIFLSPMRQHALDHSTVNRHFHSLIESIGLPPRQNRRGPRLHDLRHTFAVHRLEKWYRAGESLDAKLPLLSAYMGHKTLHDTYYYLRITSSFFPEITRRLEAFAGDIIPKGAKA